MKYLEFDHTKQFDVWDKEQWQPKLIVFSNNNFQYNKKVN